MRPLYILYNVHKKGAVTLRQPLFPLFLHFVVFGFRSGGDFKRNPLFPDGRLDEQHDRCGHTQAYRRTKLFKIFLQLCVNTKTYTCLCDSRSPPSVMNRSLTYMKFICQNDFFQQRVILSHLFPAIYCQRRTVVSKRNNFAITCRILGIKKGAVAGRQHLFQQSAASC